MIGDPEHVLHVVHEPFYGGAALYLDGELVVDSGENDVSLTEDRFAFWTDALEAVAEKVGIQVIYETRMQPTHPVPHEPFAPPEYETYWPGTLGELGPAQPPEELGDLYVDPDGPSYEEAAR